ncbi:hypothetical protein LY78DRAFT_675394 [Colletotrichum sublineola]|nr:hypothetical protein LY78DRAFT_675394 [Colletotrichum sublineola]
MEAKVNALSSNPSKVKYSSQVTALIQVDTIKVNVNINSRESNSTYSRETRSYSYVFNTTALSCLKQIDTTAVSFNSTTRQAIYNLPPGTAVKHGGLSHSDLNIHTSYHSYFAWD